MRACVWKRQKQRENSWFRLFCADFALRSVSVGRWHTLQKITKNEERTTEKERKTRILVIWCQRTVPNVKNVQFIDAPDNKNDYQFIVKFFFCSSVFISFPSWIRSTLTIVTTYFRPIFLSANAMVMFSIDVIIHRIEIQHRFHCSNQFLFFVISSPDLILLRNCIRNTLSFLHFFHNHKIMRFKCDQVLTIHDRN